MKGSHINFYHLLLSSPQRSIKKEASQIFYNTCSKGSSIKYGQWIVAAAMAFGLISSSKNAMDAINIDKALFVLTPSGTCIN